MPRDAAASSAAASTESGALEAASPTGTATPAEAGAATAVARIDRGATEPSAAVVLEAPTKAAPAETALGDGPLRIHRGEGFPPIEIPRDEQLFYDVAIKLGVLGDLTVGQVVLSAGVEDYVPGLPPPGEAAPVANGREVGWIHSLASGYYLGYRVVHNLDARLLPQDWPSIYYRDTQNGSENRRSELKVGRRNGEFTSTYLADRHCAGCNNTEHFVKSGFLWQGVEHCHKCKLAEHRVWKGPETRTVPPGCADLLSAVYLARTMVQDGRTEVVFPVVSTQRLWTLTVKRGRTQRIHTPAGTFSCALITLATSVPAGEPHDEKSFAGLFGIRGDIRIWMDAKSGVPVVIEGDLPVPVLGKLEVEVELKQYAGTPKTFVPLN